MNKEEKFIEYLSKLKSGGNAELLESVISGFKTLVEYRVGGSISERQVDIMESEDEMVDESESFEEEMLGDMDTPIDESSCSDEDSDVGISDETNTIMEEGEGEIKGKLTPELYKKISKEVDDIERQLRHIAYQSPNKYAFKDDTEREDYIEDQLSKSRGKKYASVGIPKEAVKGLGAVKYESVELMESIKRLNSLKSLLNDSLLEGLEAPRFDEDPIIPNALSVISSHPNAIEFTDKGSFDSFLNDQKYFSASYSHCFYSIEEMEEFRQTFTPVNMDCVILRDTGRMLVAVWDSINSIGYIIPSKYS